MKDQEISIGQSEDNDIVIKHDTVSRNHALIHIDDNGDFWIKDLNSTNGIYVNNRRVKRYKVDEKDLILLGGKQVNSDSFFSRIHKILLHRKTDFTKEYLDILSLLEAYETSKRKISNGNKWPKIIRLASSILLILILLFFPNLIPDPNMRYVLIVAIGTVPVLLTVFTDNKQKNQAKADLLKLEYEDRLKCPKCKTKLIQYSSVYLKAKGSCVNEKCNATFQID